MKNRLMNNWQLKLLSLAAAILLWLVVVSINDPVVRSTYSNMQVEVINSSVITSEGKVYEILDNSNVVTIEVYAHRSAGLTRDDFKVTANMQDIQLMKYVPITVTCTKNVEIQSMTSRTANLKISIEDSDTKTLPVVVRTTGTPGDGYVVDKNNTIASPESVRITGAASAVKKIAKVYAEVDVSGLTMDTERVASLTLYDSDGDVIKNDYLTYNVDINNIAVSVKLLRTKEVPVRVSVSGTVADGYRYTKVSCEPSTITLAGKESVLEGISAIEIPSGDVSVSLAREDVEKVVDISAYLPENTQLAQEEDANVAVTVTVEKLAERTVTLEKSRIDLLNVPEGYTATFLTTADLSLQVRALQENMDALDVREWKAWADLSECTEEDTYEVPVTVEMPDDYELAEEPVVVVKIEKDVAEEAAE